MAESRDRQAAFRERRLSAGEASFTIWVNMEIAMALRKKYPGSRGGIDWALVIRAAMEPQAQPDTAEIERLLIDNARLVQLIESDEMSRKAEVMHLLRKVRTLEKNATETARRHREEIDNWRQALDQKDSQLAKAEAELKNPDQGA